MEIQPLGLFTENVDLTKQLKDLYPASTYKQRPEVFLHYLIALDQPFTKYINPTRLKKADPANFRLTPLHVAAMKGDLARAEILIKACDNPKQMINARDDLGWTPLHFAAVTSNDLFQRFKNLGGNPQLQTYKGADCDDLLMLTGRMRAIRPSLTESAALFPKGFFFTDSPLYPKEKFHQLYLNDEDGHPDFKDYPPKLYDAFRKNPPPLYIEQCEEMKDISPYFLDCKAKGKILSGQLICEYTGLKSDPIFFHSFKDRFEENKILQEKYILDRMDAHHVGNETRFCNTGFPNAISADVIIRGVKRRLLIAIRDIDAGESIRFDYGIKGYSLSFGRCLLLGKEEMVAFFQSDKDFFNSMVTNALNFHNNPTAKNLIKKVSSEALPYYVLNSPTALLYLHFHDIVDYKVWQKALEDEKTPCGETWKTNNSFEFILLLCMFDTLGKLENNAYKQWAAQKLEKEPLIHILKGLDLLISGLSLPEIDTILADYDWQKDLKHYPFNLERRARIFLEFNMNMNKWAHKTQFKPIFEKAMQDFPKESEIYQMYNLITKKL